MYMAEVNQHIFIMNKLYFLVKYMHVQDSYTRYYVHESTYINQAPRLWSLLIKSEFEYWKKSLKYVKCKEFQVLESLTWNFGYSIQVKNLMLT